MRSSRFRAALEALGTAVSAHQGMTTPLLAVMAVCVADILVGPNHFLAPLMVVAPALAVATTTWRRTLVVGAVGGLAQAVLVRYDATLTSHDRRILAGMAVGYLTVVLFSAYGAWWRELRSRQFQAVVSVAEAAQRALLRPPGPRVGGLRLAVRYSSAADAAQIGGDLYAVLDTPYGVRVLIGDVRGKGLDAVQTSAVVLGAFREAAYDEDELTGVARRVDASVARHVPDGEFTTALFAEFPGGEGAPAGNEIEMLHYGHVPGLKVAPDATVTTLEPPEPWVPLGLTRFVTGAPVPWRVPLSPDDVLVLCTDGVVEARGHADGEFYPLAERIGPLVAGAADDLEAAVEQVSADLLEFTAGTRTDDSVLLLLARGRPAVSGVTGVAHAPVGADQRALRARSSAYSGHHWPAGGPPLQGPSDSPGGLTHR
ncbi:MULTISPECIES: PP2C family protein-serine/threonine phosphatase [Streptomycetaceae]|uniref:Integral membrane protein n=1 Tax=Streptantibioticus cattleyicolor (strain ATCC 35852 / DSM 46488 / JCM 4925 / NBRC 14057 / NRRL 8057) TaxID=1003195 RepID=F8JTB7_STREN|nr:PP2C family protein-serine/threonine phosphatase [Streptantibioticus cattleyicolor]AEW94265.1 integral membrane protein [Streptantibioticus cattleyicolor NRRL 8057 = DSM 46488]MYS58922.1 SpoIIE family protein phosphatase [Streptomyces sp. SID5468]CCB74621.1 putative integral membrane protein [Streptantibioticus cattleyicolor NRRL 8057 = DSM 46488]